jgi:nucleoside deoxyribosyltransferase
MTEVEVIEALKKIEAQYPETEKALLPGARSVYLAGGWWGELQPSLLLRAFEALLQNPSISHIHVPVLHQYKGVVATDDYEPDMEWAQMTFKADILALNNTDLYVGLYPVEDQDTGTAMELGYAFGKKPIVNVYEGDWVATPVNLMMSMGADAYVRSAEALKTFDFLDIEPNLFEGKII